MTISLVIGGVLVATMLGVAAWGWVTLPADARIPVHYGIGGYNNFVSKTPGLLIWAGAGILVFAVMSASAEAAYHHHDSIGVVGILMPVVVAVLLLSEWAAISRARKDRKDAAPPF